MEQSVSTDREGWTGQASAILRLGLPLVGAQLAQLAINTTGVLIVGHLGASDLAGIVLSIQYFYLILHFGSGSSIAIIPLVAHALGRGDTGEVRRSVRMGIWASLAYAVMTLPLFIYCEPILTCMGQKPDVVAKAASYLRIMGFGLAPALTFLVLKSFLSALGRTRIILAVNLVCVACNALLAYMFTLGRFGVPAFGLPGAASVAVAIETMFAASLAIYIGLVPACRRFRLHSEILKPDWPALREVLRHGIPISMMVLSEMSLFSVAAVMIGWIDTLQLAAHGVAMQLVAIAFMVPLGLSQAATVRIGVAAARNDGEAILKTGIAALAMAALFAAFSGGLFITAGRFLAGLFVDKTAPGAETVVGIAVRFIMIAGAFQLFDALQSVAAGLARGLKDSTVPMVLAIVSYWCIGFPSAYLLAFSLGIGGIGIWYGFVAGLIAAAVLLIVRFVSLARSR
ncbi:MATE family efflux transporter [Mesorhizobium sp. CU2]|uniref:MATE family efflux transporter n=1 Tax=unclassified Mesorhizobium TaxID=325217 RepID=UPI00112E1ABD|nr:MULTISPECIES: MATE family efflux transporter [unclassified Mesorhizobium]TPN85636.1 MATE family efflux transporter [Mesorhizobium sp. CU3]TPO04717.1 MATE family efflux transporter [Mesorhizobium sp. CU2]